MNSGYLGMRNLKMKKNLMLFLLCVSACVFAYEYNGGTFQYHSDNVSGTSNGYVTFTGATNLYFTETQIFTGTVTKGKNTYTDSMPSIVSWGAYKTDSPTSLITAGKNGFVGTFSASDTLGIWMRSAEGNIYTSTATGVSGQTFAKGAWHQYSETSPINFCLYDDVTFNVPGSSFNYTASHFEYTLGSGDAPLSGQPLPGVLASILVGGAGLWAVRRRSRKQ